MAEKSEAEEEVFDFSKVKWERGLTPDNITQTCFDLCKNYLGGVWVNLNIDQIVVNRLSGGLTNQLYYCAINDEHRKNNTKEPQEVAIRLYQEKHFNNYENNVNERLTDTIIALLVSENGLGPKIYGLFEGGQIQKYYKHKPFRSEEMKDSLLVEELGKKLAKIHSMFVPIKRTGNWVFDTFDNFYKIANERFDLKALYEESNCLTLQSNDLAEELEWLKKTITENDSPFTFTHVDFRGSNIMVTEGNGIVLCDFEYSCYGYRGVDFGCIFAEWDRVWGDFMKPHEFPDDSRLKPLVETYINESINLMGKVFTEDKRNTVEHIVSEGKVFTLMSNMFFVLMTIKANESIIPDMPFDKKRTMAFCEICYKNYHQLKQRFIKDNVF